jgi:hypothetical protein
MIFHYNTLLLLDMDARFVWCYLSFIMSIFRNYQVLFGGHRLVSGTSVGVQQITRHPQYQRDTLRYDAALLLLDEIVPKTDKISTIRLADRSPDTNETCIVNGIQF